MWNPQRDLSNLTTTSHIRFILYTSSYEPPIDQLWFIYDYEWLLMTSMFYTQALVVNGWLMDVAWRGYGWHEGLGVRGLVVLVALMGINRH